jgi:hypothetical protein
MDAKLTRRDLLHRSATLGALATLGAGACNKPAAALSCTDTSALSPGDVQVRTALAYLDTSADPTKACSRCQQFVPAASGGGCGTCKVVRGPINPAGSCKSFAPKSS